MHVTICVTVPATQHTNTQHTNTIELIGHYGSDELIALSAWTSTSRELTDDKRARIPQMLKMLAENGHETPFEKSSLHFLITTDIATHIHVLKHRISSLNGESARYRELKEDKFYLPDDWPINGGYVGQDWLLKLMDYTEEGNKLYHECLADLTPLLGRKRAKESARFFKTYNSQITADLMFNWRSFKHFLSLRKSEHAQDEIHALASQALELVRNIDGKPFEHTIAAFGL